MLVLLLVLLVTTLLLVLIMLLTQTDPPVLLFNPPEDESTSSDDPEVVIVLLVLKMLVTAPLVLLVTSPGEESTSSDDPESELTVASLGLMVTGNLICTVVTSTLLLSPALLTADFTRSTLCNKSLWLLFLSQVWTAGGMKDFFLIDLYLVNTGFFSNSETRSAEDLYFWDNWNIATLINNQFTLIITSYLHVASHTDGGGGGGEMRI